MEGVIASTDQLFATETMAELCVRQGRTPDAIGIYRRLVSGADHLDARRERWLTRLHLLEGQRVVRQAAASMSPSGPVSSSPELAERSGSGFRLPLLVRLPVRAGQVVYAEGQDLIVLAPVNPGAQLIADGNIHVYAPLRGRAVAGARGCREARIFCQRLEPELIGIDDAYLTRDDLPVTRVGKPGQIFLEQGRCVIADL